MVQYLPQVVDEVGGASDYKADYIAGGLPVFSVTSSQTTSPGQTVFSSFSRQGGSFIASPTPILSFLPFRSFFRVEVYFQAHAVTS